MQNGFSQDPTEFLTAIKAAGENWTPLQAARLVMGTKLVDRIRNDMGDHWLNVVMSAHLQAAIDVGEWSFAHSTLRSWLDYQSDKIDDDTYRQRLVEHAEDGKHDFLQVH